MSTNFYQFRKILFVLAIVLFVCKGFSQNTNCQNADFEDSTFTNWLGFSGSCCPVVADTPGIINGRHTIIKTPGIDPNTCGGLQIRPAIVGGCVCRLGNQNVGFEAEKLIYTMTVDSTNSLFVYHYAIVLQDPGHPPELQPSFKIRFLDQAGSVIDSVFIVADTSAKLINCGIVRFKDWTTSMIDLSAYINQNIQAEFTTSDCGRGAHFGYAYIDCYCTSAVNVKELMSNETIKIYPNPITFASTLQLNSELKDAEVFIYDMLGKEMMRKKMDGDKMEIEKGSLAGGVYFVRVSAEERQWVGKMVVE